MTGEQKRKLEQRLWDIANTLRGKMDGDEFRDYILGFIFYKYLSEKMHTYACRRGLVVNQSIGSLSGFGLVRIARDHIGMIQTEVT